MVFQKSHSFLLKSVLFSIILPNWDVLSATTFNSAQFFFFSNT